MRPSDAHDRRDHCANPTSAATTKIGWLDSKHTFSFGDYYDPAIESFGAAARHQRGLDRGRRRLSRRIGHRDMEIVTYLIDGALQHKDSIGGGGIIRPGEIQRMSAGRGIVHAEFNASARPPCSSAADLDHAVQDGIEPSYEQKTIDPARRSRNRLRPHRRARSASQRSAAGAGCGNLGGEAGAGCRSDPSARPRAAAPGCRWQGRSQSSATRR